MKARAVSHVVNTIISLLPHFPSSCSAEDNSSPPQCSHSWPRRMISKTRFEQESRAALLEGKVQEQHAKHTVKQKKGALRMLPKYVQCTGMQHGALGERNKDSTVSGSLSPVLPHPHIISWKIPDICCNFFLPPPPLSVAIAGTDKGFISRCRLHILYTHTQCVHNNLPCFHAC